MKSHLTLHRQIALKKPYRQKTDQNFPAMRAAEQKRRRKHAANLALAQKGQISIVSRQTHLLWTP